MINKVYLFLPNLNGGGAERVFVNLAKIFRDRGLEVILVLGIKEGTLVSEVSDLLTVDFKRSSVSKCLIPLTKFLRFNPPDILISAMPHANLICIIASRLANKKIIIIPTVHEDPINSYRYNSISEKFLLHFLKIFYPMSNALVTVSDGLLVAQKNFYRNSLPKTVIRIYNPIISYNFSPQVHQAKVLFKQKSISIISAGRLSVQKSFQTLITAFSQLDEISNKTLTIYGEGPEREKLENLIKKLKLENKVFLPGFSKELNQKMIEADIFILSSKWEGFGNVLVEALACGCQVISTNCQSGPSEILKNGQYGTLVTVDDCHEMKIAIERLINGNSIQYNIIEAITPFTFKIIEEEYISLFESLLNIKSKG